MGTAVGGYPPGHMWIGFHCLVIAGAFACWDGLAEIGLQVPYFALELRNHLGECLCV